MATTPIENIVNELTELVVQKVLEEFHQRADEIARRLGETERAFAAQPVIDANFVDERIERWMRENLNNEIADVLERVDIDYKIQRTIEDIDFDDAIKEAVEDQLERTSFIDEEDLQNFLGQHEYVNVADLIEFLNDRVRITVE